MAAVAAAGVDSAEGGLLPEDKLARVAAWQASAAGCRCWATGVNDAPVLARADVSVAMGGGADVARMSGDMVLVNDQLQRLDDAVLLARRTLSVIRQNLWWAAL